MTTVIGDDTPILMIMKGAVSSKPPPREPYRYYHCREDWNGLHCKKVAGPSVMPTEDCTKLIAIKSYIPESFDKVYLKYEWIPKNVFITKEPNT